MGRPSKLTDRQWAEIQRRLLAGEKTRALAKEFGIGVARISERFSERVPKLKALAHKVATVEEEVHKLPVAEQAAVLNLADCIRGIFDGVHRAARAGAQTAARLHEQAMTLAEQAVNPKADEHGHRVNQGIRDDVTDLQIMANRALSPALRITLSGQDPKLPPTQGDEIDLSTLTPEELDQAERLALKAKGELA